MESAGTVLALSIFQGQVPGARMIRGLVGMDGGRHRNNFECLRSFMAVMRSVTLEDRIIDLHKFSGEVMEEKKWSTTQVSGGGGGYNVGSGHNNPVTISSVSSTHDQFFLKDENGKEMTDAGLALRKGHRVTVLWGVIRGQERGQYVAVLNHATNNLTKIDSGIVGLAGRRTPPLVPLAWILSIFGICLYGLGIVAMIVLFITGRNRKKKNDQQVNAFRTEVDAAVVEMKAG